ncbi:unnamed protein product [Rhizoctonia solani]|uniref:Uncharacterized protein n=1 Tax=Rhizoctonia solani TaxID=456999 RepID=A0A8H3E9E7_9AGAM|nr:unnamed protein product [Rhizoctonia solani]
MVDLAIGLGISTLAMVLHVVVQGHRFDIIENVGCYPTTFIYGTLTGIELVNRRLQYSSMLSASKAGLNTSQYFRLMAPAAIELLFSLPLSIYILITSLRAVQNPWISWDDTHQNVGRINRFSWACTSLRPSTKRRAIMVDLAIGLGIPTLAMVLHVVVQGHRFDIIENVGCYPTTCSTLRSVPMVYIWPILLGSISFIDGTLTVIGLVNRRLQFSSVLSASKAGLNTSQYFRLMALAAIELLFSLPLSIYILITSLRAVQNPWISWDDTHQNVGRTNRFSWACTSLLPSFYVILQILRWAPPALGIMFFLYFGVAGEAIAEYRRWIWALAGLFGKRPNAT